MIITEKDVRCTGSDCRHCSRRPSKLDFTDKSYSAVEERLPTPYEFDFRPDPAAKQRRRDKSSSRYHDRSYSDDDRYTMGRSNSMRGASDPITIPRTPPRRSNSMYENDRYGRYYSSPPTVHQDSGYYRDSRYPPSRSARIPLGFYEVLESSRPSKHSSDRRRSASPLDTPQKTDEYDPERRRLRSKHHSSSKSSKHHHQPAVISYGADPLLPAFEPEPYGGGSSSARRYSMDSSRSRSASLSASSPPKSVRWGDDPRFAQNQKISSRARRDSVSAGVGTGGDAATVKGILKHNNNNPLTPPSSPPTAPQPLSSDTYDALYKSAQSIGVDERPTTPQRQVLQERSERSAEIEGLRKRLSNYGMVEDHRYSPFESQRYGGGWGEKASSRGRRSERFYDDVPTPPHRRDSFYY